MSNILHKINLIDQTLSSLYVSNYVQLKFVQPTLYLCRWRYKNISIFNIISIHIINITARNNFIRIILYVLYVFLLFPWQNRLIDVDIPYSVWKHFPSLCLWNNKLPTVFVFNFERWPCWQDWLRLFKQAQCNRLSNSKYRGTPKVSVSLFVHIISNYFNCVAMKVILCCNLCFIIIKHCDTCV